MYFQMESVRKEKEVEVDIPQGIEQGNRIKVEGNGGVGHNGGPQGDLYLVIVIQEDKYFEKVNNDLYLEVDINVLDLIQGKSIEIYTPSDKVTVEIPEGSKPSTKLRVKNKGFKIYGSKYYGDMYITFNALSPKKISRKDKELLDKLIKNINDNTFDEFSNKLKKHIK